MQFVFRNIYIVPDLFSLIFDFLSNIELEVLSKVNKELNQILKDKKYFQRYIQNISGLKIDSIPGYKIGLLDVDGKDTKFVKTFSLAGEFILTLQIYSYYFDNI